MSSETDCIFVSSRGILKSCKIRPNPPISSCATNIQYLKDFIANQARYEIRSREITNRCDNNTVNNTDKIIPISIYVCCDALNTFVRDIVPFIRIPFYVVCGDGDLTVYKETFKSPNAFLMFILSPFLRGFFSQNMDIQECRMYLIDNITKLWLAKAPIMRDEKQIKIPTSLQEAIYFYNSKLQQLPIGLDYHTISSNPNHHWRTTREVVNGEIVYVTEGNSPKDQETILMGIRKTMTPFYNRVRKIYSNVLLCPDRFNDRVSAVSTIPNEILHQQTHFLPRTTTWKNMTNFAFVLSPFGNGKDSHRTWEALLCGCIPIVRTSIFSELFYGLPVLIVNDWIDITPELLEKTIEDFKERHDKREFQYERLELAYYSKKFT